ncbi:MAG: PhoU domain-containing protein [Promethearchaeota archaeon]
MGINIEHRKVQQTGGSSYIITLPIEWIKRQKILKNDTLGIIVQPDGNLLITPYLSSVESLKTKKFDVDNIENNNFLFRLLIGAYIIGYSIIIIESSKKIELFVKECVEKFTQIAIGPEIIEESNNQIFIKDLLNPKEMPFEKTIKRIYVLAESMHEEAFFALKSRDEALAETVIKRDDNIDRLHWLVSRQAHIVIRDMILCQKMGITLAEANHYQQISRLLERIGDHAVKIAKNVILIINRESYEKQLIERISTASKISLEILGKSMDAWLQKNIIMANDNIEAVEELINECENITLDLNKIDVDSSIALSYIIESIQRTGEYAGDISEIIINGLI